MPLSPPQDASLGLAQIQGMTSAPPRPQSCSFFLAQPPASLEESVGPSHDRLPAILRLCDLALAARVFQGGQNQQQAAALPESPRNRAEVVQRRLPNPDYPYGLAGWLSVCSVGILSVDRVGLSPKER